jgi:DNA-3-methyladenine glycosylase II
MKIIDHPDVIAGALKALRKADPRLKPVIATAGPVPLRRSPPGFASLVSIVISQQVSKASAEAIEGRLRGLIDPLTAPAVLSAGDEIFRQAGLSRPKQATVLAAARAVEDGLDLHGLCSAPHLDAIQALTAIHGIGAWTAEIYLLFCAGHPDIFPARDIALQNAVGEALGLAERPGEKTLAAIAESWSPWRGVAARLFWAYYAATRGRDALPVVKS